MTTKVQSFGFRRLAFLSFGASASLVVIPRLLTGLYALMQLTILLLSISSVVFAAVVVERASRGNERRNTAIGSVAFVLSLMALFVNVPMHFENGTAANESAAVGVLRNINRAQQESWTASNKYACSLPELESRLSPLYSANDGKTFRSFIDKGIRSQYIFVVSCESKGWAGYQSTAVPQDRYAGGVRSFCTDQTGVIRYSNEGDVESCKVGMPLQ